MIKKKKKVCKTCGELEYVWSKKWGCKKCSIEQGLNPQKSDFFAKENVESRKKQRADAKKNILRKTKIKAVSTKRQRENQSYSVLRNMYLRQHPKCERCGADATEIHHRSGRTRERLNDSTMFMSTCRQCHRYIHEHPQESYEKGWMIRKK